MFFMTVKKHKIDVLITGPGGELIFKEIEVTKDDIKSLLETKDSFVKHNIEKELKKKKIEI